ncbi:MAG: PDP protein [Thiovulaceae bacterium]|nr:PDP protein [Sulfurimonadaceae bacterium]
MKKLLILGSMLTLLYAEQPVDQQTKNKTYDCTKVFESRKEELILELEKIDEQNQALEALQEATTVLLDKKKVKIEAQQAAVEKTKSEITAKEARIVAMLKENKQILEDIQKAKMTKVTNIYAKMKAGAAAEIFSKMELKEASEILGSLPPKILGKVLAKMKPEKAAKLTHEINKDPVKTKIK